MAMSLMGRGTEVSAGYRHLKAMVCNCQLKRESAFNVIKEL
jgi:hypothetical protein